ncbi:cupin domain-containing protein [Sciscionella sediminilitoris]|uniref:cupin domain-containing protein n=1 Tax=Sciscionella sediminilitoris TaxID=1445613 RepID=UPI0004DF5653|nr:cupin domain-containing protein [Sciscionella sp. SE31]
MEPRNEQPRVLADTRAEGREQGVRWRLQESERDLDANIIALGPHGTVAMHTGAEVDVLLHVLSGSGQLATEEDTIELFPGALLWLPRYSRRAFAAGPEGLRYLTTHRHRQALHLAPPPPAS